ncbi:MAG TPA: glycosyltransferase [Acidimicrobiales bacterium]|nr:glycosyltransferase [Acidimicrobiales bacterium]
MSVLQLAGTEDDRQPQAADVEIVLPVYNEATQLEPSVTKLRRYLDEAFPFTSLVTVVDNASTDDTWTVAEHLAASLPGVRAVHLGEKGRGRALRAAWSTSTAEVVAYMDVDLSTGLDALLPLVAPLLSGHSDVAIGSRLAHGAHVVRGAKRELISRCYNLLLRVTLQGRFSDAQCGFKALRREAAAELLPSVADDAWFFDTELLVQAERRGLRIHEVPVDWVDDPDSRVDLVRTALDDLRGVWRLFREPPPKDDGHLDRRERPEDAPADELLRFAGVGVASTVVYLLLFVALRYPLGALAANAVAIVLSSLANTAVHWRLAADARQRLDRRGLVLSALALLGVSLGLTTAALVTMTALTDGGLAVELVAIALANALAAIVRFSLLRAWVFRPHLGPGAVPEPAAPAGD